MLNKQIKIKLLLFVLFCAQMFHTICMDTPKKPCRYYKPIKQPKNSALDKKRQHIDGCDKDDDFIRELMIIFPSTSIEYRYPPGSRSRICYDYAIRTILAQQLSLQQLELIDKQLICSDHWLSKVDIPFNFFNQVKDPAPGDLVMYMNYDKTTSQTMDIHIKHFGVIANDTTEVISKIGIRRLIIRHNTWETSSSYGTHVTYWRLKKNNDNLFKDIISLINSPSSNYFDDTKKLQQHLFSIINGDKIADSLWFSGKIEEMDRYVELERTLIDYKNFDLNCVNESGETMLMIAAQKGDAQFVTLLLEFGADATLQNKNGCNANDLARLNKHTQICDILNYLKKPLQTMTAYCIIYFTSLLMLSHKFF
ncbi:MAG TPA: ankyrin repeat domain-containing protein [Candidatus Babeliales bacterium]|nr:ankyrin repeat domain-containing protein [Candidatus Babeliales bacterium]